ncbi:MAG: DUF116 domain-containing protein [Clostridia bacterium]|nr:DUF116 domain-containing protein [Clostridia bacterium]
MNKSFKAFLLLTGLSICIMLSALAVLSQLYRYSTKNAYELILLILMMLTIIIIMLTAVSTIAVYYAYSKGRVGKAFLWLPRTGLRLLLPFIMPTAKLLSFDKEDVRRFYIDVNNILVRSGNISCEPKDVLLLLPHCLQHSGCWYKITSDIRNCRKCGKCCIGEILEVAEGNGINAAVATGGTIARNIIFSSKPKLVLSVACERDLASGIADVKKFPVLGIINERPNGPCNNTVVDVDKIKEQLEEVLGN